MDIQILNPGLPSIEGWGNKEELAKRTEARKRDQICGYQKWEAEEAGELVEGGQKVQSPKLEDK